LSVFTIFYRINKEEKKIMKRHWRKGAIAFVALVMVAFMASSAMAIILTGRSEEMTANSTCDLAGTMDLRFNETDYDLIRAYLDNVNTPLLDGFSNGLGPVAPRPASEAGDSNFVLIRATLGGENIEITAQEPRLCRDIMGEGSENDTTLGASGTPLPNDDKLVVLDEWNVEVSDISDNLAGDDTLGDGYVDVRAFVYGVSGSQSVSIYLTDLARARNWNDETTWPWIKVGLYQKVTPTDGEDNPDDDGYPTSICVNVAEFGTLAILDVSLDIEPTQLTYTTSDNQIGHFLRQDIELRECSAKNRETDLCDTDETVELCEVDQDECPVYEACVVAEGTYPSSGAVDVIVRSNGATNGANTQEGIYIQSVLLYGEYDPGDTATHMPLAGFEYFRADGTTEVDTDDLACGFEAEHAKATFDSGDLNGNQIQLCIRYNVNPAEITRDADGEILNPTVQFWIELSSVPCGDLLNDVYNAATLVECGEGASCMYFPYVLHGFETGASGLPTWSNGIAVANLGELAVDDMEVTVTLTDSAGTAFTGNLPSDMITGKVFAYSVDAIIAAMGWEPAAGPAWVMVVGNFPMDGYHFMFASDLGFGAGTLPRALDDCAMDDFR
jgi:hypothetical protein